jgi:uncharacterized protein (TIGR02001 family)
MGNKMKFKTLTLAALMSVASVSFAYAEEQAAAPAGEQSVNTFSGTLTMVSDYVWRGTTQNDEHPAVQGSFDYSHASGLYAGVWGSNVDFNDGGKTSTEVDFYAGFRFPVSGDLNIDLGGLYVLYPGTHQNIDHYNYFEAHASVNKDFGFVDFTLQGNYSPEFSGKSGNEENLNLSGNIPVADTGLGITGSVGHTWIEEEVNFGYPDWTDWSAGLTYSLGGFDLALKYTDTDLDEVDCPDGCDARAVFSVSRTF